MAPNQHFYVHAGRSRAILAGPGGETVATDAGKKHARGVTNTLVRLACVDKSGQAKFARFLINSSIGVGVLTVSIRAGAENARHGTPMRSRRTLAILKKS